MGNTVYNIKDDGEHRVETENNSRLLALGINVNEIVLSNGALINAELGTNTNYTIPEEVSVIRFGAIRITGNVNTLRILENVKEIESGWLHADNAHCRIQNVIIKNSCENIIALLQQDRGTIKGKYKIVANDFDLEKLHKWVVTDYALTTVKEDVLLFNQMFPNEVDGNLINRVIKIGIDPYMPRIEEAIIYMQRSISDVNYDDVWDYFFKITVPGFYARSWFTGIRSRYQGNNLSNLDNKFNDIINRCRRVFKGINKYTELEEFKGLFNFSTNMLNILKIS